MASMGVPGLANFAGELMVFFGSFSATPPLIFFAVIAIYGTVITAIYQLRAIKTVFYGPMPARYQPEAAAISGAGAEAALPFPGMTDASSLVEHAPYVLLILASLVIGFMPFLLIHIVEPSVSLLPFIR
jgi:NADH-quinone oxidoreductase subunit M